MSNGADSQREICRRLDDGGVQLASGPHRWHVYDNHVHLCPAYTPEGDLYKYQAEPMPFIDNTDHQALVIVDMQNDFCSPEGWVGQMDLDYERTQRAIPGVQRAIDAAREKNMWVIWVYWESEPDLRSMGATTLFVYKRKPDDPGFGEDINGHAVLTTGSWGCEIVDDHYNAVLLEDATKTTNPDFCKEAVVLGTKASWGFVTTTEQMASAEPVG